MSIWIGREKNTKNSCLLLQNILPCGAMTSAGREVPSLNRSMAGHYLGATYDGMRHGGGPGTGRGGWTNAFRTKQRPAHRRKTSLMPHFRPRIRAGGKDTYAIFGSAPAAKNRRGPRHPARWVVGILQRSKRTWRGHGLRDFTKQNQLFRTGADRW